MADLDNTGFIKAICKEREEKRYGSIFDHTFFRNAPAMASLKDISEPKPDHIRACLMEMAHYMISLEKRQ